MTREIVGAHLILSIMVICAGGFVKVVGSVGFVVLFIGRCGRGGAEDHGGVGAGAGCDGDHVGPAGETS